MTIVASRKRSHLIIVLAAVTFVGCGKDKNDDFSLTPVAGTVLLDGQPLPHADLEFHFKGTAPEGYKGAATRTDADGSFQIKSGQELGILPGQHTVTVTRESSEGEPEIPKQYASAETSDLELRATSDRATGYTLELSSKAD